MIQCTRCKQDKDESAFRLVGKRRTKFCDTCRAKALSLFHSHNGKHRGKYTDMMRERNRQYRLLVVQRYGGKCVCCGERDLRFLTLDHKAGGGKAHRDDLGKRSGPSQLVAWAIRNDFPDTLQLMCFNCNCGRERNGGICPHESEPQYAPTEPVVLRKRKGKPDVPRKTDVLTEETAAAIRSRLVEGVNQSALAREFGVSPQTVCDIKMGRRWPSREPTATLLRPSK